MGCGTFKKVTFDESADKGRKRQLENDREPDEDDDDDNDNENENENEENEENEEEVDEDNEQEESENEENEDEIEEGDESLPKRKNNKNDIETKKVKKETKEKKVSNKKKLNNKKTEERKSETNIKNRKVEEDAKNQLSKKEIIKQFDDIVDQKLDINSIKKDSKEAKRKLDIYEKEIYKKKRILNREEDEIKIEIPTKIKIKNDDFFGEEEQNLSGDEFLPVRPYASSIFEPTIYKGKAINSNLPEEIYKIEYVYGFRCEDVRQNVYFLSKNKIIYMTAALGVILNISDNTQHIFGGSYFDKESKINLNDHGESILSLAISSDKKLCATGECSNIPSVYIWRTDTCELYNPISKLKLNKGCYGIIALSFSNGNEYLAVCEKSEDNKVYVFSIKTGKIIYSERNISDSPTFICSVSWSGKKKDLSFMTVGINHVKYWKPFATHKTWTEGNFANFPKINFGCVTSNTKGFFFAGAANGNIYVWKTSKVFQIIEAHLESVLSINFNNNKLISGGCDNKVIIFDDENKKIKEIILRDDVKAVDYINDTVLASCENGSIYVYNNIEEEETQKQKEVMSSHHKGEAWGLDIIGNFAITTGDDNKIIVWDIEKRKKVKSYIIDESKGSRSSYGGGYLTDLPDNKCSRCLCKNSKNENIAVATNAGIIQIRKSLENLSETIFLLKEPTKWVEFMSFSPDGNFLAVGCHDNKIYIYNAGSNYELKQKGLEGNSNYICSFDWSTDNKYLRTNSASSELLFFDIESMTINQKGGEETRNVEWESCYDKFAWESEGIFPEGVSQGSHIQSVCLSKKRNLLATSDCWYLINVFRFPCREKAKGRSYRGHSSIPSKVKFNENGNYLLSLGGADKTLIQRKLDISKKDPKGKEENINSNE